LSERLASSSEPAAQIVPMQRLTDGAGTPLFCVHAVSGVSWPYRVLDGYVDGPIVGIQQPPDDTAPRSLREMAARYADRIQADHPDGPYHLLGWSFGGVVAHAVAVELQRRGGVVARLVLLDAEPALSSMASRAVDRRQLDELVGASSEFAEHRRLLDQLVANFDVNIGLYRDHDAEVFDGDLVVFAAEQDEPDRRSYLYRSWRPHVTGDITVHAADCSHQAMLTTDALSGYGRQLGALLGRETM
jgi:thioesterase domain-containing protein